MLRIDFVTLFPQLMLNAVDHSMLKRAQMMQAVAFGVADPREFAEDRHRSVDDAPAGGGAGMVMMCDPVVRAVRSLNPDDSAAIVLAEPTGRPFRQRDAQELATRPHVVFVCGHYEGIDARVEELLATHVFSLGDFVLTGGELPSLVMADAVVRLLPGVLGSPESLEQDSFSDGLLSAPQFTGPDEYEGLRIPEVLKSGDHGAADAWRRLQSLLRTRRYRPDLFARARLDKRDVDMLSS